MWFIYITKIMLAYYSIRICITVKKNWTRRGYDAPGRCF